MFTFWHKEPGEWLDCQLSSLIDYLIKVVILFIIFSSNSFATNLDLFDMLKRMSDADRNQSYQGTFILRKSDNLSTWRVTHGVDESGVWESIEMLNGEPKTVIRHNNQVVTIFPDQELITIRHTDRTRSLHLQLPKNIEQLELFYSLNRLSDDRIANRRTLVVELLPKDQYRYGYRYWVDKDTGMLLRCDLVVEDGDNEKKVIEQMMFVSLDYLADAPASAFKLEKFSRYRQQILDEPVVNVMLSTQQHWVVNTLPDGFMLTQSTMRHSQPLVVVRNDSSDDSLNSSSVNSSDNSSVAAITKTSPPDLLHLVFSDGLASVSIFIEKNQRLKKHLYGAVSMGAVNAFGHSVGDYFVTVVGEVPAKTVESMARSTVKLP